MQVFFVQFIIILDLTLIFLIFLLHFYFVWLIFYLALLQLFCGVDINLI